MKATIAQMKKKIQKQTANTGTSLHRDNPYWMNSSHISYMRQAFEQMVVDGHAFPEQRFTPTGTQAKSLSNWIDGLADKYLNS